MLANPLFSHATNITPSDTVNLDGSSQAAGAQPQQATPCDAVYVGGAGVLVVVFQNGTAIQFTCIAGQVLPVRAVRVNSTSTTATLLRALYGA